MLVRTYVCIVALRELCFRFVFRSEERERERERETVAAARPKSQEEEGEGEKGKPLSSLPFPHRNESPVPLSSPPPLLIPFVGIMGCIDAHEFPPQ